MSDLFIFHQRKVKILLLGFKVAEFLHIVSTISVQDCAAYTHFEIT